MTTLRTSQATAALAPAGLEGVVVAETSIGDVRGLEGFYHYREYSAVDLAQSRSFSDVIELLFTGSLPAQLEPGLTALPMPPSLAKVLPQISSAGTPLDVLRSAISLLGAELGWTAILDLSPEELQAEARRLCAVVPTVLSAVDRLRRGLAVVEPREDLGLAENYLWMLHEKLPDDAIARAIEQYLMLVIDHGFNASTFTARVVASTGADLASCICGAIGAMSGPLHGGAPSRAVNVDALKP